jgi:hypothetical protein
MFIQVADETNNRHMGSDDLGDAASLTLEDMAAYAEMMDRTYSLGYHFSEGDRYEVRVWDGEDCIWDALYVYEGGELTPVA